MNIIIQILSILIYNTLLFKNLIVKTDGTTILADDREIRCKSPPNIKFGSFRFFSPKHKHLISNSAKEKNSSEKKRESNFLPTEVTNKNNVDSYPEGTVIEYYCNQGFWIHPASSARTTCHLGKWSNKPPLCVVNGCSQPLSIMNGYYLEVFESSDNFYPLGARIQFICHVGYLLKGPDMFTCSDEGKWSPGNQPECVPSPQILNSKKCSVPPDIWGSTRKLIRGIVGGESSVHGTVIEYRCRPGYRNIVAPCVAHTLTCHKGEWRGTSPQCEEFSSCIAPPNVANGFMYEIASSYPLQSQVYYSCERGYRLLGPSVLTCEDTGCWTPSMPPICQLNRHMSEERRDGPPLSIHTLLVAAISGIIALLCLLVAVLLYHRAMSPKLVRLRNSTSGSELQPRNASNPCPANGQTQTEHDPDRVALIAFHDELIQNGQGEPPTYEEAVRQRPAIFDHVNGRHTPHTHRSRGHRVVVAGVRRPRHRDNPDNISYQSIGSARQSSGTSRSMSVRSWSACDSLGSTDTVAISDSTNVTVDTMSSGVGSGGSQAPSCRGLAGSRASFDTSSLINSEDAPLIEEAESEELRNEDRESVSTRDSDREMVDSLVLQSMTVQE